MIRLVFADAAEHDLTEIAARIASDNTGAALRFVESIREHCFLLQTLPFMGRPRADIHPDIRSFPHRSYTVYYRKSANRDEVEIFTYLARAAKTTGGI